MFEQLKPKATKGTNTKELLLKDQDFSKPSDHLFAWVNEQQRMTLEQRELKELNVLKGLKLNTQINEEDSERIIMMKPDKFELSREQLFFSSATGKPKHTKADYKEHLEDISMNKLLENAIGERKKVQFEETDDQFKNMLKIEAKKEQQRKKKVKELKSIKAKNKKASS